jgi:dipeptidyl aminopeptidase/acylaminoacyl peptidase
MGRELVSFVIVLIFTLALYGQGSAEDYQRARQLQERWRDLVSRTQLDPNWLPDGKRFWYRLDLGRGAAEFVLVDAEKGERRPAFDHAIVAEALAKAANRQVEPKRLPFDFIVIDDQGAILFRAFGKTWRFDPASQKLDESSASVPPPSNRRPSRRGGSSRGSQVASPDGRWTVQVRDYNLHLRSTDGESFALTNDGTADDFYNGVVFWSPDSRYLAAMRTKQARERQIHLIESSPRDQLQPKLHTLTYPKPGDPLTVSWPRLFDVSKRREIPLDSSLFPQPWSFQTMQWTRDPMELTFVYNQRGHQVLRLIAVDPASGKCRVIIEETSKTFIDYAHKFFVHRVADRNEWIWMSERDGWNHLYLIDGATGQVKNRITRGSWVVRGVESINDQRREIVFRLGGIDPKEDPYHVHYARASYDGGTIIRLTRGDGTHQVRFSPDHRFLIDSYSRVDLGPIHELRRTSDGELICELERADLTSLRAAGWRPPERFVAKGRDGQTDIYGIIHRPTTWDPVKKYPVIEEIYAGPHGAHVPKSFSAYRPAQELAELGFIVVQIDGMGTSYRSKAFHDVCWRNLGDSGFPDRIAWIKAAAAKDPSMDLRRVGIYGASAGGQSALRALLAHGEFYHVGVAVCGCHDNRMDKVWWNELWMGYPVGPHYADQSNVTQAHRLQGKLLLIVGELDRNVDPASTMQVVNALIKADKDFDLLVIPGGGHGIGGPYGWRRLQDFFVRHLWGKEPRHHATANDTAP